METYSPQIRGRDVKRVMKLVWDEGDMAEDAREVPAWKRALDLGLMLFALPAALPLGAAIALWIKLSSPGPVFFRQERVGLGGERFTCLKFRSMKANVETKAHREHLKRLMESNTPMTKMDAQGDSRLIPLGALLRSTGLDELPQLINVLRGEMSLVGPRPCIPYEYEGYLAWQKRRFQTLPGLTGLWQVSGKNRTTFKEMIELDLAYVERQSLWLDLMIILRTVPALLAQVSETRRCRKSRSRAKLVIPSHEETN